ncbi:MAG: ECF-type sigma factor [Bryobacteraceae bacterium]
MAEETTNDITQLLRAWAEGDPQALESLTPRVYQELRRLARHYLHQERAGHSMQTTDLVHEAYLRLVDVNHVEWQHSAHFYSVAAMLMRRILVDRARKNLAAFDANGKSQALAVVGEVWVRADYLPLRVTLTSTAGDVRQDATVDYALSRFGALLPAATRHRETRAGVVAVENNFSYSDFKRLSKETLP